jgi:hypothetical protein
MSEAMCPRCGDSGNPPNAKGDCRRDGCPFPLQTFAPFKTFHVLQDNCAHEFAGWRDFADGLGGEQVCRKCGMGAMTYSLRNGP